MGSAFSPVHFQGLKALCNVSGDRGQLHQKPTTTAHQRKGDLLESLPEEMDRTFVRTHACGDALVTTFGPTGRTPRRSRQSGYFSLMPSVTKPPKWEAVGCSSMKTRQNFQKNMKWSIAAMVHYCRTGDIVVILGLWVKQHIHWVVRTQPTGFFYWVLWKLIKKKKHEHNVCSWTETSPSNEPAPFALFAQYPASPSVFPSLATSTRARCCSALPSLGSAAAKARGAPCAGQPLGQCCMGPCVTKLQLPRYKWYGICEAAVNV